MGFPKGLLAETEKVVFDIRPHWITVVPSALWTIALTVAWIFLNRLIGDMGGVDAGTYQKALAVVILLIWAWLALIPFLRWRFTNFVLTSDRLITRRGIIAKHSKEIPLERINDVAFSQSVLERFLGAGDLMIESAGERGQERIENIRKPEQIQLMIFKASESNTDRMMSPRASSSAGATIPAQIEHLARLRDQGVLSEEEFAAKKSELLGRL